MRKVLIAILALAVLAGVVTAVGYVVEPAAAGGNSNANG